MTHIQRIRYAICVKGQIDSSWVEWFEGFSMSPSRTGETILSGFVADQAALHDLLNRLFAMNFILISVHRVEPGAS